MWPETREKIEFEIAQLQRLVDGHRSLIEKVADAEPDTIELSALSAYLHSLYNGIENLFKQIAVDVDGGCPISGRWHAELLESMAASTERRPAVISVALHARLVRYMGFRHVFRHAYTFDLKWSKVKDLVTESEDMLREVSESVRRLFH